MRFGLMDDSLMFKVKLTIYQYVHENRLKDGPEVSIWTYVFITSGEREVLELDRDILPNNGPSTITLNNLIYWVLLPLSCKDCDILQQHLCFQFRVGVTIRVPSGFLNVNI
jgi:hypothetical protein